MSSLQGNPAEIVASAVARYADVAGGLMPLLHEIQAKHGHIPKDSVAGPDDHTPVSGRGLPGNGCAGT